MSLYKFLKEHWQEELRMNRATYDAIANWLDRRQDVSEVIGSLKVLMDAKMELGYILLGEEQYIFEELEKEW